jgi:two-component system, OmpR family, KDP operon response regulator KdpE
MSLHVLLVEDDRQLRQTLQAALETHGYAVTGSASRADAEAVLRHHPQVIDLVILDLGLPDADGSELLARLRQQRQTPVLIISARHDDAGKVKLLDAGADDYLVKPFNVQELLARMRVSLRHRGLPVHTPVLHYSAHGLEVDVARHQVSLHGQAIHLTPTEFRLLARLVRQAGQVVTHRQLLADVWGPEHVDQLQYLRLYMGQLRAKLEARPAEPQWLLTEPGVGYRLAEAP